MRSKNKQSLSQPGFPMIGPGIAHTQQAGAQRRGQEEQYTSGAAAPTNEKRNAHSPECSPHPLPNPSGCLFLAGNVETPHPVFQINIYQGEEFNSI